VNPFSRNWLKYKRNSDEARIKPANTAWRNLAEPRTQGEQYFGAHILAGIAVFLLRNIIDKVRGYTSADLASKRVGFGLRACYW
jgi:hypothetical protein